MAQQALTAQRLPAPVALTHRALQHSAPAAAGRPT